jgi:hypothetical protein
MRADHGWTGRANSALPLRAPGRPMAEMVTATVEWYSQRHLPARIHVAIPPAAAGAVPGRHTVPRARGDPRDRRVARRPLDRRAHRTARPHARGPLGHGDHRVHAGPRVARTVPGRDGASVRCGVARPARPGCVREGARRR